MLRYSKGKEPACLAGWQATPQANWNSLGGAERGQIREALLRDQGALCAYCQRRIANDEKRMKIEHWEARSEGGGQLQWSNLLGVCPGNSRLEGDRRFPFEQHCDDSRGNRALYLHPVEGQGPDPGQYLRYTSNGQIYAGSAPAAPDLAPEQQQAASDIEVLNLNARRLRAGREAVYDRLHDLLKKKDFSVSALREQQAKLRPGGAARPEHAEFALHHLRRWLRAKGERP